VWRWFDWKPPRPVKNQQTSHVWNCSESDSGDVLFSSFEIISSLFLVLN
jgi:hypothetical protein